jgi:hypothetical protein
MPNFLQISDRSDWPLADQEFLPNRSAGVDRVVGPLRRPPTGHRAMRQQASSPRGRHGVAHLYDTRTGVSCDRPGAPCESNVLKWPASVREERVLCKSILSPQREPMGESIIRRSNRPCYQKCDADSRNFCRSGKNFQNRFPRFDHVPLALRVGRLTILAWQPCSSQGFTPMSARSWSRIRTVLRSPWYKPCCCMHPCCSGIIRAVIAGGQSSFSSCDTSLRL